jgi:hypothetical protein
MSENSRSSFPRPTPTYGKLYYTYCMRKCKAVTFAMRLGLDFIQLPVKRIDMEPVID